MDWFSAVAALFSTVAAVYAAYSASRARASEAEAARLRDLEQRLSSKKIESYEGILIAVGNLMTPESLRPRSAAPKGGKSSDPLQTAVLDFMSSVVIYGSDEVVQAFSRFRIAGSYDPPTTITMRLVADFMRAVRRDLDGGRSSLTGVELIGMRINDLYSQPKLVAALTDPFEAVCEREGWIPPWSSGQAPVVALD